MSKAFLRRKVSSTKVTDWVDPSFDDFSQNISIPAITATSFSVNNSSHRRKNVPSTLESSSFPSRKRATLSSSEQIYALENSKNYLSENEPWVDKYKPETQHELAVHKKKIEEVETWLKAEVLERQTKQIAVFKEFLLRATKYNKLQMVGDDLRSDKKVILVEDLPNQFYRDSHTLHEVLRTYVQIGRCPLIFIISGSLSGDNNQRLTFPKEIQEECAISNISFNPVAPTIMMKFLTGIVTIEANKVFQRCLMLMDRIKRENRFLPGKHRPEASTPSDLTTLALANKLVKQCLSGL